MTARVFRNPAIAGVADRIRAVVTSPAASPRVAMETMSFIVNHADRVHRLENEVYPGGQTCVEWAAERLRDLPWIERTLGAEKHFQSQLSLGEAAAGLFWFIDDRVDLIEELAFPGRLWSLRRLGWSHR